MRLLDSEESRPTSISTILPLRSSSRRSRISTNTSTRSNPNGRVVFLFLVFIFILVAISSKSKISTSISSQCTELGSTRSCRSSPKRRSKPRPSDFRDLFRCRLTSALQIYYIVSFSLIFFLNNFSYLVDRLKFIKTAGFFRENTTI